MSNNRNSKMYTGRSDKSLRLSPQVGQRRPCSVEMSSSESKLRNGNVISETCPPSGSGGPLQVPSVTSEGNMTVKLTDKGLHGKRGQFEPTCLI